MADQPERKDDNPTYAWITKLGDLRDGLLLVTAAIYGLGYLVWSLHAWSEGLGLLPALEPQYLAAGTIPALMLGLAWLGRRVPGRVVDWIREKVENASSASRTAYSVASWACFVAGFLLLKFPDRFRASLQLPAACSGLVLLIIGSLLNRPGRLEKILMYLYVGVYFVGFMALYLFSIYPSLPEEFGGVRPRCAYVDVVKGQISGSARKDLLPDSSVQSEDVVVKSARLRVFFSGSEFMLVKPYPEDGKIPATKPKLYELKKSVVQTVNWCD